MFNYLFVLGSNSTQEKCLMLMIFGLSLMFLSAHKNEYDFIVWFQVLSFMFIAFITFYFLDYFKLRYKIVRE